MRVTRAVLCALVLLAAGSASAELPTVSHDGRAYVELARIAERLQSTLDASGSSTRATLRTGSHRVTLTRNWAQVLVDGRPIVLDAPVRVRRGVWLVPEAFVARVMPRLVVAPPASSRTTPKAPPRLAPGSPVVSGESALGELRFRSYPSFTRVVLETSAPVASRVEARGGKETRVRLFGLSGDPRAEEIRDGFVHDVKLERAGADAMLGVGFEGAPGDVRITNLTDPPRLVLDFLRPTEREPREPRQQGTPLGVIVLDAGHGGHDPGATGPTGLAEKDLVLDVTRRVGRLIEERLGIKAVLSREADHFVPLRDRTSFANRERADVFVSIHANAHRETASTGVEIYFLSSEATDSAARQVAALENAVVQLEKPAARGRLDAVRSILWDLAQSEFQLESSHLAEVVLDSMTRTLRIPNRGVKQAGFYVLGGAAMPAILIEIGFVTNPREERKLRESRYRDEIARAIVDGLADYKRHWDQRARTADRR